MTVFFVGAGPGDPDLLTVKATRLLETCRVCIYTGSLVPAEIVQLCPTDAALYDSAGLDLPGIIKIIQQAQEHGLDVVRLHTGDPSLYSAIGEQMHELDKLGIDYGIVPGVSAFQAAAASIRCELTLPEISQTVVLTRLSGRTPVPEKQALEKLAATSSTLCLYLSVHRMDEIVQLLTPHYGAGCPAAVVYRASQPSQKIIQGSLGDIATRVEKAGIQKTAMVLIGWSLGSPHAASRLYDPGFSHGYRTA